YLLIIIVGEIAVLPIMVGESRVSKQSEHGLKWGLFPKSYISPFTTLLGGNYYGTEGSRFN
ncbi:MAG: hypothetical protein K2G65_01740, partial [Eubacterium sp.]|nr:hypothetical protein [Eubacterium sp.]